MIRRHEKLLKDAHVIKSHSLRFKFHKSLHSVIRDQEIERAMAKINPTLILLLTSLLISSCLPISHSAKKKPQSTARKNDIPYIRCQVCQYLATQLHHQVKKKQSEIYPKKVSEFEIIEISENVCNLKKEESDWIPRMDIVKNGNKLELVEQDTEGQCNSQCKTIERVCQEVMGYSDTDVAEYMFKSKPQIESLVKFLCNDLTKACSVQPPPLPKSRAKCINVLPFEDYEGFIKYVVVGDEQGMVYVFLPNGDIVVEFITLSESSITAMVSYMSIHKNESVLVTGHDNGVILVHRIWEALANGEVWHSLSMANVKAFESEGEERLRITILEVHQVGRMMYILSSDASGKISVFSIHFLNPLDLPIGNKSIDWTPAALFIPKAPKEAEMEKIMKSMEGKVLRAKEAAKADWKQKVVKGVSDWKQKVIKGVSDTKKVLTKRANKVLRRIQQWWRGDKSSRKPSKGSKSEL
ncbi:hypothetical protein GIB67_011032 [Kingdonia uniflora]|uniref:Uncharacterized protein n=1 Tax=Kingdonia uniflora TaxID=39325 RepID=A0A7J7L6H1_9MAGN|nr:hypothetical protein GIB67_011032 [Kingdonia uniflora]